MSDEELSVVVRGVQRGDEASFEQLVRLSEAFVFATVARQLDQRHVETVAQEVFLAVFEGIGSLHSVEAYWGWLRTITHRKCADSLRDRYRRQERRTVSLDRAGSELCERWLANASAEEFRNADERDSAQRLLHWALEQLGPEDRMIVTLVALEEMSISDAASAMGWTRTATKVRMFRARRKLRSILDHWMNEQHGN